MPSLYVMQGAPGSGKSTWIRENGLEWYVIRPDDIRMLISPVTHMISDDGSIIEDAVDSSAETSRNAFNIARSIAAERFYRGETVILDSCAARRKTIGGIVQDAVSAGYVIKYVDMQERLSEDEVLHQNAERGPRAVPEDVVRRMYEDIEHKFQYNSGEHRIHPEDVLNDRIVHTRDLSSYKAVHFVGDVQGCYATLEDAGITEAAENPDEIVVFAGDLLDRGPADETAKMFDWVRTHVGRENIVFVTGNHDRYWHDFGTDAELRRATAQSVRDILQYSTVGFKHGSDVSEDGNRAYPNRQLEKTARAAWKHFVPMLACSYRGREFVVTHAGLTPSMIDDARASDGNGFMLGFTPVWDFVYGSGKYSWKSDYQVDIDEIIEQHALDSSPIQVHGHRNEHYHGLDDFTHVFNLESRVEHPGGALSVVDVDASGIHTRRIPNGR